MLQVCPSTLGLSGLILLHSAMSDTRWHFLGYLPALSVITTDNAPPAMEVAISSVQLCLKSERPGKTQGFQSCLETCLSENTQYSPKPSVKKKS